MLDDASSPHAIRFESARHERAAVTVAITLFNYGDLIEQTLESVAAQELPDLDLIVVDDCSTDGGDELVLAWMQANSQRFGRSALVRHRTNEKLAAARNHGFARARTPFVFVLDADNEIYPRCLSACLSAATETEADAVYTLIEVFGEATRVIGTDLWDPAALRSGNYIDAMALIRRAAWQKVGGYRSMSASGWEDYDLWLEFARANFTVVRVPEILCRYRQHGRSMLRTITRAALESGALQRDIRRRHPGVLRNSDK